MPLHGAVRETPAGTLCVSFPLQQIPEPSLFSGVAGILLVSLLQSSTKTQPEPLNGVCLSANLGSSWAHAGRGTVLLP